MKTLYLVRHAKSSWKEADLSDHDRPLNSRGERDASRHGGGRAPSLGLSQYLPRRRLGWIVHAAIILGIVAMVGGLPEPMPAH